MIFDNLLQITLGSFRIGAMLVAIPVFGASPIPGPVKYLLAFGVSGMLLPMHQSIPQEYLHNSSMLFEVVVREIFIGLVMGYAARLIFLIVTMALEFAGLQMGFAIASVFDPQNQAQISVVAQFGVVFTILFFFSINLHHDIFIALVRSYEVIPIGTVNLEIQNMVSQLVKFLSSAFEIALRLAIPIIIAVLIVYFIMGVISRTSPQMNLFFNIAFIVNITVGLILISFTLRNMLPRIEIFEKALLSRGFGLW